jgi:hypothetical protein
MRAALAEASYNNRTMPAKTLDLYLLGDGYAAELLKAKVGHCYPYCGLTPLARFTRQFEEPYFT